MYPKRLSRVVLGGAVSTALAVGGLAFAPEAANAASTTASYTCATSQLNAVPEPFKTLLAPFQSFQLPATFTAQNLPSAITANVPVPAGTPIVGSFDFSASGLAAVLTALNITLQSTVDTVLGQTPLAGQIPLDGAFSQINAGIATFSGQLGTFTPTGSGPLPLPVPTSFDTSLILPVFGALGYTCTLNNAATTSPIGVIQVNAPGKAVSRMKAKAKGPVHKGHRVLVKVKVKSSSGQKATGKVVAKLAGKVVGKGHLKNGKLRMHLKKLSVGVHKVKVRYLGNATTLGAKAKVKVRVLRG